MINAQIETNLSFPHFSVGQLVLVAVLKKDAGEITCVPTSKIVVAVGNKTVIFEDQTEQFQNKCFPNNEDGLQKCQKWCDYIKNFQEGFNWPICTPP